MIQAIHPDYIQQAWPQVSGLLAPALEHSGGEYTVEQLRVLLVRGEQVLLAISVDNQIIGAACVEFCNFPNDRIAYITAIGGRRIALDSLMAELKSWCANQGCTKIRGAARESVARLWRQKFNAVERYRIVEVAI